MQTQEIEKGVLVFSSKSSLHEEMEKLLESIGHTIVSSSRVQDFLIALRAEKWPLVIVDSVAAPGDPAELVRAARKMDPDVPLLVIVAQRDLQHCPEVLRVGATDIVMSPIVLFELKARIMGRYGLRGGQKAALETTKTPAPKEADPKLLADIQRFNERCLKRFIDFEREILRLRDQLAEASALHESTGSQQMLLLIHPDPALREALLEPAKAMGVIVEQVFTGGEALDKAGQLDLDGLICSDLLPDLDGQMVLSSLKGELPYIDAIQLRGWGRKDAEAVWFDDPEREEASRALAGLDDLLAIIKEVAGQRAKRAADKRLARVFKKKHKEFMHNYAEIKLRILDALSSRSPS
ncbi:response regulator [bacterium]|nr:response regulator [bacterium]